ncbi:aldose epimerase family protein [Hellea balneolensis]|uniref:aldose epimerase family protein n=1 Tax=Hellea balneolensis TaxID=287478 RepID=UPI00040C3026|nr:aldose epimerase family protein [Hellea balneolensis]
MIKVENFGYLPNGETVKAYIFETALGFRATILSYGATLQSLRFPDGTDVTLGFGTLQDYLGEHPYFGAAIGRVANRISQASFNLAGQRYNIPKNEGKNNLHSGPEGFDRANWMGTIEGETLILRHTSPDGHQGFPGELMTELHFTFQDKTLSLNIQAQTNKACPVNITYHPYFNLTNGGASPCSDHTLQILANRHTHKNDDGLPTGEISFTDNSPDLDYHAGKSIRKNNTLDQNYVVSPPFEHNSKKRKMAKLSSDITGRKVIICSTYPCLQAYTGAAIPSLKGKGGNTYGANHGVALEPQGFPNAINIEHFPTNVLQPGDRYNHNISYTFKSE